MQIFINCYQTTTIYTSPVCSLYILLQQLWVWSMLFPFTGSRFNMYRSCQLPCGDQFRIINYRSWSHWDNLWGGSAGDDRGLNPVTVHDYTLTIHKLRLLQLTVQAASIQCPCKLRTRENWEPQPRFLMSRDSEQERQTMPTDNSKYCRINCGHSTGAPNWKNAKHSQC